MVGIVIVSHSARLAEGVLELARGMAGPNTPIAAAGGMDLPNQPLGTDAALIVRAIGQVYSDAGVLVLMDLGSAILSAETALEMLPPDKRVRVMLCEAPLIEGALAAAVQAQLGSPLDQVAAEARSSLSAKTAHFGVPPAAHLPAEEGKGARAEHETRLTVKNRLGLHARPAARFVQTAGRFQSEVSVTNLASGRGPASAKSINAIATLGVRQGHDIKISASGPDAEAALTALRKLADENFGDVEEPTDVRPAPGAISIETPPLAAGPLSSLQGLAASPGLALGPARHLHAHTANVDLHRVADPQQAWDALLVAIERTRGEIRKLLGVVAQRANRTAADIFEAHLLFLDDEALREPARQLIFDQHLNAAAAWQRATEAVAAQYQTLEDEYQRARAVDVLDVGRQVVQQVLGAGSPPSMTEAGILVARDLTPADTANLDPKLVHGIATALGGPTSHSAILARSFGIPAVVGLGRSVLELAEGTPLILDGDHGYIVPDPDAALVAEVTQKMEAARAASAAAKAASAALAYTRDGRRIEVAANVGSVRDVRAAVEAGAEGVGLFRTEFLFLDRQTAPDEEEQYAAYRAAAAALGRDRPLVIRTLDVGGDKPLPYVDMDPEANPFLGWRAIRLCLARPDFFKVQLRAIARVAAEHNVKVMFPMIATLAEFRAAKALLKEASDEVKGRGQPTPDHIDVGIMVEIPAAALRAQAFAAEVDFFSIGTNDLTQYTLAAERGNARVADLADAFQPAVLELVTQTADAAHAHGKWVGVCGEMAGDPRAIPLLVGLGITELSMSAPAIPRAKQIIRALNYDEVRAKALTALGLETPEAIRAAMTPP
jgi:phosphocarrier protein FPr